MSGFFVSRFSLTLRAQYIPSVSIRDDWSHVINIWGSVSGFRAHFSSRVPVLSIMQLLGFE